MKSTGIIRNTDNLGRIVLPKELRKSFGIGTDTPLEIFTDNGAIVLKKYSNTCVFCGEGEDIIEFGGKHICPACFEKIKNM